MGILLLSFAKSRHDVFLKQDSRSISDFSFGSKKVKRENIVVPFIVVGQPSQLPSLKSASMEPSQLPSLKSASMVVITCCTVQVFHQLFLRACLMYHRTALGQHAHALIGYMALTHIISNVLPSGRHNSSRDRCPLQIRQNVQPGKLKSQRELPRRWSARRGDRLRTEGIKN